MKFKDLYPGKIFFKTQYRYNNVSKQLVVNDENRWINMEATTINCQLYRIYGWVKREQTAALKKKDKNGEVPIRNEDTGEILNLIKDKDTPTPIHNGFLVSAAAACKRKPPKTGIFLDIILLSFAL